MVHIWGGMVLSEVQEISNYVQTDTYFSSDKRDTWQNSIGQHSIGNQALGSLIVALNVVM